MIGENEVMTITQNQEPMQLSIADMLSHVNLIQTVMKRVMQDGQHYGVVPGCGDKPALLKPGAEKILEVFRLAADPIIEDLSKEDEIRYRVKVRLVHQVSGSFIGAGIGECSSDEEKYKWKSPAGEAEFNALPENKRRVKYKKGYNGKPDYTIKQIRTNPADVANTILKMAKKRALVDAALTATAASDIFAQDIDEMEIEPVAAAERVAPVLRSAPTPVTPRAVIAASVDAVVNKEASDVDPITMVSEITDWLGLMNNGDPVAMDAQLKTVTIYKSKKVGEEGTQKWLKVSDLPAIATKLPNWLKTTHAKVSDLYSAWSAR